MSIKNLSMPCYNVAFVPNESLQLKTMVITCKMVKAFNYSIRWLEMCERKISF